MATTSLGTIPEDFPINGVYEAPELADLPAIVYGMRPNFRELIWDREGGFAADWVDRSALSGNGTDGYVFRLGRRAFSAASMAIFASDLADTGGGGGDVNATKIQDIDVSATSPTDGQILEYDAGTDSIIWVDNEGGGGSFSVTPTPVVDGNLIELEGTDGLTGKDSGISTASVAAAITAIGGLTSTAVYQGGSFTPNLMAYVSGAWTGCISAVSTGTWTDQVSSGITRSGENFTVAAAGTYLINVYFPSFTSGAPPLHGLRCLVNGTMRASSLDYGGSGNGSTSDKPLTDALVLAAGDVLQFQYINISGVTSFGSFSNNQMGGVNIKTAQISIVKIGASIQPVTPSQNGGWQRVVDTNYTQLGAQSIATGPVTIDGIPYTAENIGTGATSVAIGTTGVVFTNNSLSTGRYGGSATSDAPLLKIRLTDIAPNFVLGQSELRMWCQAGSNGNANHEVFRFALDVEPWLGASNQPNWSFQVGSYDNLNPHQGIVAGVRAMTSSDRQDIDMSSLLSKTGTAVMGISMKKLGEVDFHYYTNAAADSVANLTAVPWSALNEIASTGPAVDTLTTTVNTGNGIKLFDRASVYRARKASELFIVFSSASNNTAGHLVSTLKRLVVEVKY